MLVSVIIASYNYEKYIEATLQSLIDQTHQIWECIVIDDGSRDNTKQVIDRYIEHDKRIKYVYQNNAGQASARNKGLKIAKGKYIQFLDADDILERLKLECHVNYLERHSHIGIVYGETRYFRDEYPDERRYSLWNVDKAWMPKASGQGEVLVRLFVHNNIITISSPLVRKSVIESVGVFDYNLPLEDWDFWTRCAIAEVKFHFLEAPETNDLIRIHGHSTTQNINRTGFERVLVRRKFNRILPTDELRRVNLKLLGEAERYWIATEGISAVRQIKDGQISEGLKNIWRVLKAKPLLTCRIVVRKITRAFVNRKL